jgi:hypothetical protein
MPVATLVIQGFLMATCCRAAVRFCGFLWGRRAGVSICDLAVRTKSLGQTTAASQTRAIRAVGDELGAVSLPDRTLFRQTQISPGRTETG